VKKGIVLSLHNKKRRPMKNRMNQVHGERVALRKWRGGEEDCHGTEGK